MVNQDFSLPHLSIDKSSTDLEKEDAVAGDFDKITRGEGSHELSALDGTVWRKMDRWILPVVTMFYLLSFLDRSNISNARVAGLQKHLGITNKQYSIALTVTYIPYIVAELPSNLFLKYVGPNIMLPTMVTLWGIVSITQGLIKNYTGLLICRFFLGLFEGGLLPGIILYLSMLYPRQRLQTSLSFVFAAAALSGAFGGLLAAAIENLDGKSGRPGWAWIFILEGIFTASFGILSFCLLPRSPSAARFLSPNEKLYVNTRLREDGALARDDKDDQFDFGEVLKSFQSPQVWFISIFGFFLGTILFSIAYFEPTIVQSFGYTMVHTQLMSVPPFAAAFVVTITGAYVSDRYRCRGLVIIFSSILCLTGFSMFLASSSRAVRYGSLFLSVPGIYCASPTYTTWTANNTAPYMRRATALASILIFTNSGGILATWLLGSLSPAPRYRKATITFIIFSIGMGLLAAVNLAYLWRQNKQKLAIRSKEQRKDENVGLGDRSAWFVYNL